MFLPGAWQRPFSRCLLAAAVLLIVAKDLACLPLSVQRWKTAQAHGASWLHCLGALAPPEFVGHVCLERAM